MKQIPPGYRQQSIRLLQFLAWSETPPTLDEAVDFVAVDPECEPGFEAANRMPVPKDILRLCSGLIVIAEDTFDTLTPEYHISSKKTHVVRLSHFSVKEYLTSDDLDEDMRSQLCQTAAAERIASVSLSYMLATEQPEWYLDDRLPLLGFCIRNWMALARRAGNESQLLQRLTIQLLSQSQHYTRWCTAFEKLLAGYQRRAAESPGNPLYYASMGGLIYAAQELLKGGADVNARGGPYGNALHAACQNGHKKLVAILLDNDADVDSRGNLVERFSGEMGPVTPLYSAVIKKDLEIVELLVEKGADPNIQEGHFGNVLQAACNNDKASVPLARMLLENGADVNAQSPTFGDALQAACAAGNWELVNLLLNSGADVNCHGSKCSNAIVSACSNGHLHVATLLIDRGADIDACGGEFGNAIQSAAYLGRETVVQWLLDNGADADAKGGCLHRRKQRRKAFEFGFFLEAQTI